MTQLEFIRREPLDKGWSCDRKYCAVTADGTKYLLRITPKDKSQNRQGLFLMLQKAASLGIPMCRPPEEF